MLRPNRGTGAFGLDSGLDSNFKAYHLKVSPSVTPELLQLLNSYPGLAFHSKPNKSFLLTKADVAELADALDSKSSVRKDVWVRPPPSVERISNLLETPNAER
jgi:hypothetical protein